MWRNILNEGSNPIEDTEAAIGDLQIPQVYPEVIGGDERLKVRVDRDGVDVVGVCVAEYTPGCSLNHQIHGLQHWHLRVKTSPLGKDGFNVEEAIENAK